MDEKLEGYKKILLEKIRYRMFQMFTSEMLSRLVLESADDFLTGNLVVKLRTDIYAQKLVDEDVKVYFEYPATWWQHLRKRLGLSCRMETEVREVNVRQWLQYPDMRVALPPGEYGVAVVREEVS